MACAVRTIWPQTVQANSVVPTTRPLFAQVGADHQSQGSFDRSLNNHSTNLARSLHLFSRIQSLFTLLLSWLDLLPAGRWHQEVKTFAVYVGPEGAWATVHQSQRHLWIERLSQGVAQIGVGVVLKDVHLHLVEAALGSVLQLRYLGQRLAKHASPVGVERGDLGFVVGLHLVDFRLGLGGNVLQV